MNRLKIRQKGYTFIEILVVVAIIGVLAAIGVVSYQSATKRSRDGKRKADLEQVRAALEMYRADSSGFNYGYPHAANYGDLGGFLTGYITLPSDPKPTTNSYVYKWVSQTSYCLCAALENDSNTSSCITSCGNCGTPACNYGVSNP